MMPSDLVAAIHASPLRGVIAITGGGTGSLERLMATPGASATVLEAVVPYSEASLAEWLGSTPEQACSEATAQAMAMTAWLRAQTLDGDDPRHLFGLACTASLTTSRPKRGDHRAHVAVQTADRTLVVSLTFDKADASRSAEEAATSHAIVAALADAAGVRPIDLSRTPPGIVASAADTRAEADWSELVLGERSICMVNGAPDPRSMPVCLLPGSFNPPHEGHHDIARVAACRSGRDVVFELAITNVDKPPLDFGEIARRLTALDGTPTWLTRAPTFLEKARLAPGCVFAAGVDTIERIGQGRYYAGEEQRDAALAEIARLGCRFLAFGRADGERFATLDDLNLPDRLRSLCDQVPASEFRCDVSSTLLRNNA